MELVKPLRDRLTEPVMLSLLTAVRSADSLASLDADGLAAAAVLLQEDPGHGPSFILVFTDGYGSCGLRLTSTLARLSRQGTAVVAINVGGESDMKANGLAHCYAHWWVDVCGMYRWLCCGCGAAYPFTPATLRRTLLRDASTVLPCSRAAVVYQGGVHQPPGLRKGHAGMGRGVPRRRLSWQHWQARQ